MFTRVEQMGMTDTSLITLHKSNLYEGTGTLQVLPKVLQNMLEPECYEKLGLGNPPQPEMELVAMQKQEKEYLDSMLNLEHCTAINITKKIKKDEKTVGPHTAVSGLTSAHRPKIVPVQGLGRLLFRWIL